MRKQASRFLAATLSVVTVCMAATTSAAAVTPSLNIASDAYVVMDAASGQVLVEKNMAKQKAPASITKIMTLALAMEKGGIMTDSITVSKTAVNAIEPGSTHIALVPGEMITFQDAVMGTQLISANDAANVVAEYVSGSIPAFVDGMNAKVGELGLTGTHFVNPNGLDANGHYITAYDMAQITRYAMSVPGFQEVFSATEYQMAPTNIKARNWKFLAQDAIMFPENREYYDGIIGSKLGYTYDANHTLVAVAERSGMELIVVALDSRGSAAKYNDAKALLDYCFERYESVTLNSKEIRTGTIPLASIEQPTGMVNYSSKNDHSFVVPLGTPKSALELRYNLPDVYKSERKIEAPTFSVCLNDEVLYTAPLDYYVEPIERTAQTPMAIPIPKPRTAYFSDMVMVAFKCLLVALSVFAVLFFVCRTVIMMRYAVSKHRNYKKKLALIERRQAALERSAAEIQRMEMELGMQLPAANPTRSHVPNNVSHIYPNRSNSIPPRRSVNSRK